MPILAISCSCEIGGVSIATADKILFEKIWSRQKSHGQLITPAIEDAFHCSGIQTSDLTAIAVDCGPGSFTGIRVAVNTAKTLAYSLQIPVVPFNSLEAMALHIPLSKKPLCIILNAHKNMVYYASFISSKSSWKQKQKPQALTLVDFEKVLRTSHVCVGDGYTEYAPFMSKKLKKRLLAISGQFNYPSPSQMALHAHKKLKKNQTIDWKSTSTLYIRASEPEERLKMVRNNER